MKKTAIYPLLLALLLLQACSTDYTNKAYLEKVLSNLEQIESATYLIKGEYWHLGDTIPAITQNRYVKEYTNSADTNIGASYVSLLHRPVKLTTPDRFNLTTPDRIKLTTQKIA